MIHRSSYRYEIKLTGPFDTGLPLQLDPAFSTHYPARWVNSLYFDSYEFANYEDNLAGLSEREKMRLRWYGEFENPKQARLERKFRKGAAIGKEWIDVKAPKLPIHPEDFPLEVAHWLAKHPYQSICTRYYRHYYVGFHPELRLTIDSNLQFLTPDGRVTETDPSLKILEMKAPLEQKEILNRIGQQIQSRAGSLSKYSKGIELMGTL